MKLPEPLAAALAAADEDYLIGLCNRGTVNRAKKDLAALPSLETQAEKDGVTVRVGDAICLIKVPLGESRCSCPSSGICRHRIAAILWLRQQMASGAPVSDEMAQAPAFAQLRAYPAEKLVRQLGTKRLAAVLSRRQSGAGPVMTETSVITVEMPWLPATVRLLEPLEHSTCTCHSRAFCSHKAEALLYWQLEHGIADPASLQNAGTCGNSLELDRVRSVCQAVQQALTAQMVTGLSRLPPSACETVERMAALCHTAGLPDLERALRGLHGEYAAYFGRSASFRDTALLMRLSHAFRLAAALETADAESVQALAGSFRDHYEPVGRLQLYLLGLRDFSGRSGYAGTIYYFWEREACRFYTFSDVRPTFYEGSVRRKSAAVPWGLPCPLRKVWNCALDLSGARANRTGGLSATEQCRAVLLGPRKPWSVFPEDAVDTDFSGLLGARSRRNAPEISRLAVVRPAQCRVQPYDHVQQVFSMQLLDRESRSLWLTVRYKQEEAGVISMLEALVRQLQLRPSLRPVFFGILYREDDCLKLYPIEYFTEWGEPA